MDLQEIAALLHVHETLQKHGDMFPNLKKHALDMLRSIEADHAPQKAEEPEAEVEAEEEE